MGTQNEGTCIRKGPWTAEEDEVLISHVKKCGPRDWSSIRSKGLLPRTGKSCRLRWVNKLRPNLKTGCKFSAEEERMVIQLQAQFGNKWAKIATYLPGRTDNDVKNFWSTRRKRFERILQKSTSLESQKNKGKSPLVHHDLPQVPHDPCSSTIGEGKSCCNYESHNFFSSSEEFRMVPLPVLVKENLLNVEAKQPILEATPINMILPVDSPPRYSLSQLHQPEPDFPFLSESKELDQDPVIPNLLDMFGQEIPECESGQKLFNRLPPLGDNKLGEIEDLSTPSILFDDFPPEMLDYLETLTSSSEL